MHTLRSTEKKIICFLLLVEICEFAKCFFGCIFSISRHSHSPNTTCFDCLSFDYWGTVLAFCHVDKILDRPLYQQKKAVFCRSRLVICSLFCMPKHDKIYTQILQTRTWMGDFFSISLFFCFCRFLFTIDIYRRSNTLTIDKQ